MLQSDRTKRRGKLFLADSETWHVDHLNIPEELYDIYNSWGLPATETLKSLLTGESRGCQSWTVVDEEANILGLCGAMALTRKVARVWICPGKEIRADRRKTVTFIELMQLALSDITRQWGLHRVEAIVRVDYKPGINILSNWRFGFLHEGTFRCYDDNGADYHIFAKCTE